MAAPPAFASGHWHVQPDREDEFIQRWQEWLRWSKGHVPTLQHATLIRSKDDPHLFVSFSEWKTPQARDEWKRSDDFTKKFQACRELCVDFEGGDFDTAVTI